MDVRYRCGVWAVAWCSLASLHAAGADTGALVIDAVKAGNRAALLELLKDSKLANAAAPDGTTALHWAVRADDLTAARELLRAGADAKAANRYGVQPLTLAATNGNAEMIEALLKAGANANAALVDGGETVLMTAVRTGRPEAVRVLLAHGANVNAQEAEYGETALIWAAQENRAAAAGVLIDAGADVDARSAPTKFARERSGQSVLPKGAWTPLMYAARQGALEAARTLADKGAALNLTAPDGATPLVLAIINAHYDLAALLLEKGADPNVADVTGMAALYAAVDMHTLPWAHGRAAPKSSDQLDALGVMRTLLSKGADPNAKLKGPKPQRQHTAGDANLGAGATPLMRATKAGDVAAMRLLLANGADHAATLKDGTTLIMIAAGMGWRGGFDTFRDPGTEAGAIEAIKLCLELGYDINAAKENKQTVLHGAIGRGPSVVEFLVRNGADMQARDNRGRTPLENLTGGSDRGGRGNQTAAAGAAQQNDRVMPESRVKTIEVLQRLAAEAASRADQSKPPVQEAATPGPADK